MKTLKILVVISLIFIGISSNAQGNDFVVLVTNDTIYGDTNSAKRKNRGRIQIKIDGNKRIYENDRVISYYNSSFRHRKYIDKVEILDDLGNFSPCFAERLNKHKGRINIYIYLKIYDFGFQPDATSPNPFTSITENQVFISKKGRHLKRLPTGNVYFVKKKTVQRMLPYLKDNPEIASELESKKFTKLEFANLIDRYNKSFENKQH